MALYESSTWAWDGTVRSVYGNTNWFAQTFTPQVTHNITSVILSLGRPTGDSPGEVTVSIRATVSGGADDGKPNGADLCSGTTTGNDLPELAFPTPAPEEREITFGTNPTLTAGTKYAIVVRALDGSSGDKLYWAAATSSVYSDGDQCGSNGGVNWTLYNTRELWFEEYGNPTLPGKPTTPNPADSASDVTLHDTTGTWVSGGNTDSYNIYYGTLSGFLELVEEGVTDLSSVLVEGNFSVYGKISYWRVNAVNTNGTTVGDEWYFTVMNFDPVLPTGVTLDHSGGEGGVPTGTPTGENNMITIRRLVAAARNKIFYET